MPKKNSDVIKTVNRMLPCDLSDAQQQERGSELAHAQESLEAHLLDATKERASLRKRKAELELKVHTLAEIVRLKKEEREVEVVVRHAKRAGFVEEVRTDTHEVIATRAIDDKEAQGNLLEDSAPPPDPEDLLAS